MALLSRKKNTVEPKQQIIKVNPYDINENVLNLMNQISSAQPSADTALFWKHIDEVLYSEESSFYEYFHDHRGQFINIDFWNDLLDKLVDLTIELQKRENSSHTQVVVAGGFSSGKSSFLNRLVGDGNLLPTGVQPVSVIPTYLYCSKQTQKATVKGVNSKNAVITLPKEVLQAIQHSNTSNIYIASVLEKLFVEINTPRINDIVFIDTPGYNNSSKKNNLNGKTDEETARASLKEGQALIWLVDCEKGITITEDLNIIKEFKGPKLIVFNKADKKGEKESRQIVDNSFAELDKVFGEDLIDVLAYSTIDERIYYSYMSYTSLDQILTKIKEIGNGKSGRDGIISNIAAMFNEEISASTKHCKRLTEAWKEEVKEKTKITNDCAKINEIYDDEIETLKDIAQSYVDIDNSRVSYRQIADDSLQAFLDFYNGVINFENNDHWGSSSILTRAINKADKAYDDLCNAYNSEIEADYTIYKHESILEVFVDGIKEDINRCKSLSKEAIENSEQQCNDLKEKIKTEESLVKYLIEYKTKLLRAIKNGIESYENANTTTRIDECDTEELDIFTAIQKSDFNAFVACLSKGVDMSVCNQEGYSPLTYATNSGNNEMVKFLLDNDADPSSMDKRGYNAFLTAVENQYRDLCELILSYDPDLIDSTTSNGENVEELANRHSFTKWLKKQL